MDREPNDLGSVLDSVHAQPGLQAGAAADRARQGHALLHAGGPRVLDGSAGLWCSNAGHNRDPIVAAIQRQAERARLLAGVPDRPSEGLRAGEPGRGVWRRAISTACSSAIRARRRSTPRSRSRSPITMCAARAARTRLIGRERGYHGVGFGGISVGGIVDQPQILRLAARRRRPSARRPIIASSRPSPRASRKGRRTRPTSSSASSRCTTPRPSPR